MEENKEDKDIPMTFYLYVQRKLINFCERESRKDFCISVTEGKEVLNKYQNIPKPLTFPMLKEMENLSLLRIENRFTIKIINPHKSSELEDFSKLNRRLGLI